MSHDRTLKVLVSNRVAAQTGTTPANLAEGEFLLLKRDGTALGAAETISDSDVITPVMGTNVLGSPKFGQPLQGANVRKYQGIAPAAAVEQVTYIGENGTSGDITPLASALLFSMHINFTHDKGLFSERQYRRSFSKTYTATPTGATLETDFVALINADQVCATLLTAAAMAGDAGISLTGKKVTFNPLDGYEQVSFEVSLDEGFDTLASQVDEFGYLYNVANPNGTTTGAASNGPSQGAGTYELIATLENDAVGYDGALNRTGFPIPVPYTAAKAGASYNVYVIEFDDVHESASLDRAIASPSTLLIAVEESATANYPAEYLEASLNAYMASTPKAFPAITL